MKKKYNFKINSSNKTVSINISSSVFPRPAILRAAYHFIEEAKVIVGGDEKAITVTLIPDEKVQDFDLEELAYEFNIQLISSFVEDVESERHAKLREEMMRAALSPQSIPIRPQGMPPGSPDNKDQKK